MEGGADTPLMTKTALVATSEVSVGAAAFGEALQRAGFSVTLGTLQQAESDSYTVRVDRSLPPYDLPARYWPGQWWNRPDLSWRAWSKSLTALAANESNLPHPNTSVFETLDGAELDPESTYIQEVERAQYVLDSTGGRAVVKPDRGLMGQGLELVSTVAEAMDAMRRVRFGVIQEFIPEASTTLRLVCTRRRAVASFARVAAPGDWRGNVAAGASVRNLTTHEAEVAEDLAVDAVRAMGLHIAGVDVVVGSDGPLLLEVNPAFGVKGLLRMFPAALDDLVNELLAHDVCQCGDVSPHDAWACP